MDEEQRISRDYLLSDNGDEETFVCENCGHQQGRERETRSPTPEIDTELRIAAIRQGLIQQNEQKDDDSDTESVVSVSLNPIEEIPLIHNPFSSPFIQPAPKWQAPRNVAPDRDGQFKWEKPHGGEDTENETPAQRIRRLEQTIDEKKQDLDVLGKQLSKAQQENYKLAEEIRAFKGDHYDDLKEENVKLEEMNGRMFRENMLLRAEMKKMTNPRIKENEEKRILEERYGVKSRRASSKTTKRSK